jgi:hypothetical protein
VDGGHQPRSCSLQRRPTRRQAGAVHLRLLGQAHKVPETGLWQPECLYVTSESGSGLWSSRERTSTSTSTLHVVNQDIIHNFIVDKLIVDKLNDDIQDLDHELHLDFKDLHDIQLIVDTAFHNENEFHQLFDYVDHHDEGVIDLRLDLIKLYLKLSVNDSLSQLYELSGSEGHQADVQLEYHLGLGISRRVQKTFCWHQRTVAMPTPDGESWRHHHDQRLQWPRQPEHGHPLPRSFPEKYDLL